MSVPVVLAGAENRVAEGSTHRFRLEFADEAGNALQLGAIAAIACWLDDHLGSTINSRSAQNVLNAAGGTLVTETVSGVARAVFYLSLDAADAVIVSTSSSVVSERHRVTIKVTYTKSGGGTGTLTAVVFYDVWALSRI